MNYKWKIENLDYLVSADEKSNVVSTIHWRLIADESGFEAQVYGAQTVTFLNSEAFISYENLKETDIVLWLETEIGVEKIEDMKQALKKEIEVKKAPLSLSGLPWPTINQNEIKVELDEPVI